MKPRIWLSVPHMGGDEEGLVHEAFATNWLSTVGPHLTAFEQEFSAKIQVPAALALGSGTAAIHLALRLLDVGPGDEVVCPTLTFVATANPIGWQGATPIFVDSDRESWNLDPERYDRFLRARAAVGRVPKALIVVHLYGQSADLDPILETSARYGVAVIEDAAEALGATYKGQPCGSVAPLSAFSFNGNKIITTTGGGMLVGQDPAQIDKARFWSTQARDPGVAYHHTEMGYNYRLSNVLAGIGRGQLRVLDQRVAQRRAVAFRYRDALADLPGWSFAPQAAYGLHTNWLSCFTIDPALARTDRDGVLAALTAENIEARPLWKPMHQQPLFHGVEAIGGEVADQLFRDGLCLPSSSSLSDEDQDRVIAAIRAAS